MAEPSTQPAELLAGGSPRPAGIAVRAYTPPAGAGGWSSGITR